LEFMAFGFAHHQGEKGAARHPTRASKTDSLRICAFTPSGTRVIGDIISQADENPSQLSCKVSKLIPRSLSINV
ncbi:MAG: hypothetical protein AAF773_27105, partial [Cyanobacteria bacterium P01_D01_bin.115]